MSEFSARLAFRDAADAALWRAFFPPQLM